MKNTDLILITGLPASGKSGFAAYAGRELQLPVLEKDHLKELLFDDIGFRSREEKVKLGVAAMDLMYEEADLLLSRGISVILDNNFENISMPGLQRLIEKHKPNVVTVRFEGDTEAIYRRFIARDRNPKRHPGHVTNTCYPPQGAAEPYVLISREDFEKKFRERGVYDFYPGGKLLTVDVTTFENYSAPRLLQQLKAELTGMGAQE